MKRSMANILIQKEKAKALKYNGKAKVNLQAGVPMWSLKSIKIDT